MTNQTGSKFLSDQERRQKIAAERTPPSVGFLLHDLVQMDEAGKDKPLLDPNHSHFILVDKPEWNGLRGFGADIHFRAAFESAVVGAEVQERLSKELHGMDVRGGRGHASHNIADHEAFLKWKEVDSVQASKGTEIKNERLAARLENVSEKTIEFKQEEDGFKKTYG